MKSCTHSNTAQNARRTKTLEATCTNYPSGNFAEAFTVNAV